MADVVPISEAVRASRENLLARHLDARNKGDIDGLIATFRHPRVELIPSGRVLDGAADVRSYLEDRKRAFPDLRVEPIHLHHGDDTVIAEFWMSGTHQGTFDEVEATGRRFKIRGVSVYVFDGDLIGTQRLYYDTGTVARQLA